MKRHEWAKGEKRAMTSGYLASPICLCSSFAASSQSLNVATLEHPRSKQDRYDK